MLLALEKVDENSIIQKISNTLSEEVLFPKKQLVLQAHQGNGDSNTQKLAPNSAPTMTEQPIEEDTVQHLSDLHKSFVTLSIQCIQEFKEKTESGEVKLADMVMVTKQERVYNTDDLNDVETVDNFFDIMKSQYHFLNTYLLLDLAEHFLKSSEVLENLRIYFQKVRALKMSTKIRSLQRNLKPYVTKSPQEAPITITVQYTWEEKELRLVEVLLQTLFRLKHEDIPKWFRVVPGSLIIVLLVLRHSLKSLMVLTEHKTQFMRLVGVVSLQVGNTHVSYKMNQMTATPLKQAL